MKHRFYKYQGTGNDFIIIDDRDLLFERENPALVAKLCNRRFGIGADGLMLLQNRSGYDFEMVYFNSDGNESSMCGNGGRCIVSLAHKLGLVKEEAKFRAVDGDHRAVIDNDWVSLNMNDVSSVEKNPDFYFLNTGSPHYVRFVSGLDSFDVVGEGKAIRYNERFTSQGTNVNFVEQQGGELFVRTYERGVEDETLSCGTGVTASALVHSLQQGQSGKGTVAVRTPGGKLTVQYRSNPGKGFDSVRLEGPAIFVFKGEWED